MGSFMTKLFVDPGELPHDGYGIVQLIFLTLVYGYILSYSSNMISDGSELLLLIPSVAGIVGSVVLPILGAVPDGAIVLFSGLGPIELVRESMSVGVGALAGSTIMLLTLPWAACIVMGRVNLHPITGQAHYKGRPPRLSPNMRWSLLGTGITPRDSIWQASKIMMGTALSYVVIQISAFAASCGTDRSWAECQQSFDNSGWAHWFALVSLLLCVLAFIGYIYYNVRHANDEEHEELIEEVQRQAIESGLVSLSGAFGELLDQLEREQRSLSVQAPRDDRLPLFSSNTQREREKQFHAVLRAFFNRFDRDNSGTIDRFELRALLDDMHEPASNENIETLMSAIDTDKSGDISFAEFTQLITKLHEKRSQQKTQLEPQPPSEVSVNREEALVVAEGEQKQEGRFVPLFFRL
jgi:hypothetical protein